MIAPFSPRAHYLSPRGSLVGIINNACRSALAITLAIVGGVGVALADPGEPSVSEVPAPKVITQEEYAQALRAFGFPYEGRIPVTFACSTAVKDSVLKIADTARTDVEGSYVMLRENFKRRSCFGVTPTIAEVVEIVKLIEVVDPKNANHVLVVARVLQPGTANDFYTIGMYAIRDSLEKTPKKKARYKDI